MPRPPYRSSSRGSRGRKPADPMLMGEPSPALTKIGRMNTEKLTEHIEKMKVESERMETKIGNLSKMTPVDEPRIEELKKQLERLAALMEAAQDRLAGKVERRLSRDASPSRGYRR